MAMKHIIIELKDKLFNLPYVFTEAKFDANVSEIIDFLKKEGFLKSLKYFEEVLEKKAKWAKAYYSGIFDGDISTTSRAEIWNAVI